MKMDELRNLFKRIENAEQLQLRNKNENSEYYGSFSLILIVVAFIIAAIISLIFLIRILKDFTERAKLQEKLQEKDKETAARIEAISTIAINIAKGNYDIRVSDSKEDALGSVGESLNNMSASLQSSFSQLSDKEWLQSGRSTYF